MACQNLTVETPMKTTASEYHPSPHGTERKREKKAVAHYINITTGTVQITKGLTPKKKQAEIRCARSAVHDTLPFPCLSRQTPHNKQTLGLLRKLHFCVKQPCGRAVYVAGNRVHAPRKTDQVAEKIVIRTDPCPQ